MHQNIKYTISNTNQTIPNTKYTTKNIRYIIPKAKYQTSNAEFPTSNVKFPGGVKNDKYEVWRAGTRPQNFKRNCQNLKAAVD